MTGSVTKGRSESRRFMTWIVRNIDEKNAAATVDALIGKIWNVTKPIRSTITSHTP